jgi:hypothetical protein
MNTDKRGLQRIDREEFSGLKQKHQEFVSQFPLINGVLSGVQHGFVYADAGRDSFYVCTKSGFSLVHTPDTVGKEFLDFLLQNKEIPEYIHLYRPDGSFQKHLEANWPKFKVRRRVQFHNYHRDHYYEYKELLPAGYDTTTAQDIDFDKLEKAFGLNFASRYWNSKEDFLNNAVGACIVDEHREPAAICYSACVVDGIAEMDTLVLPEHRGKRFMRIVSEPFFNQTIDKNLVAHWDTFIENSPSYVMAQKFDLTQIQEYDLLSVFLR